MSEQKKPAVHESRFHLAKRTEMNPLVALLIRVAAILLGMVVCGLVAYLLIEKLQNHSKSLSDFYYCFIKGSFTSERKVWKFLKNMAILQCISLAVVPAFRMRFWNIGAEGQTLMGVLGAITVAFYFGGTLPEWLLLILMFIAALLYGAVWAVIPALFKAGWNTNETLFTLMMNYVATYVVSYFLVIWVPNGSSTLSKLKFGKLPPLPFGNQYLLIILIALALTVALFIYLRYSKQGYEINVVGESMRTAQYSGINVRKVIIRTMVVSGLLCGLTGFLIGAGLDQSVNTNSVGGQGFTAIIVSWLANFNPLIMIVTSALVSFLNSGAAQISQDFNVSGDFPEVVVGIILFFFIGSEFFIRYKIVYRHKAAAKEAVK
ncbi:MAG: ABC transporter permease [Aristaeellaceae bacterium]